MKDLLYYILSVLMLVNFSFSAKTQDTTLTFYPDTDQRWEKIFNNGEKTAENIYYADNTPWMTVKYTPNVEENWEWFHSNGNPYFKATIANDLLQGKYQIWYENGQLAESLNFKDNIEDGPAEFYHSNGQLAMKGLFSDGRMVGDWKFYDENGYPPTGMWEWKFAASQGNTRVKGLLIYGTPSGTWTNWATANQGRSNQKIFKRIYEKNW